jgi:hypothetical protein
MKSYKNILFNFSILLIISWIWQGDAFPMQRTQVNAFLQINSKQPPRLIRQGTTYVSSKGNNNEDVRLGTKEYYSGFLSRDLKEADERITGDKVLIPTLKFVGGFTVVIGLLLVGFLASNGIIRL